MVTGGYEALLAAAGITAPVQPARVLPLLIELSYAGPEGLRVTRAVRLHAARLRDRPPSTADATAGLPLGSALWSARTGASPRQLVWEILTRRELAYLYYGLLTMDAETLAAAASDSALADALVRRATLLPAHARGIRIARGRVEPAGGDALADAWTALVGHSLDRPSAFVAALLSREDGRAAHFYKTVAALSAAQAAFIAGPSSLSTGQRRLRLGRLYHAFARTLPAHREGEWLLPRADAASVLFSLEVGEDGRLAGPPWTDFWKRAFAPGSWADVDDVGELDDERTLGPVDVITLLCGSGTCDERKVQTFLFLQRQFSRPTLADAAPLLAAAWVRQRFPALALELERMHLGDPAVYLEMGRAASALDGLGGQAQLVSTVQFQSAAVMLERLRRVGAPAPVVRARMKELAALPLAPRGYDGALVRWLSASVLAARDGETADDAAVRQLAGTDYRGPEERVEWEGLHYRVDLPSTEARRIRTALRRFTAHRLESAAKLVAAANPAGGLAALASGGQDPVQVRWGGRDETLQSVRGLAARTPGAAADIVAADALAALVYALALDDPENSIVAGPESPRRHVLVPASADAGGFSAWTVPAEQRPMGGGRRIVGSLLALDAGVPALGMRRLALGRPASQSNLSREVIDGLLRATALTSIWTVRPDAPGAFVYTGVSLSPCLCLAPPSERWARLGLPRDTSQAIEMTAGPMRRVVEELAQRKMPVVLAPGVLRLLMSDLVENAAVPHPDDVTAVLDYLRAVPSSRFDDYIAAIAARGPLSPVEEAAAAGGR